MSQKFYIVVDKPTGKMLANCSDDFITDICYVARFETEQKAIEYLEFHWHNFRDLRFFRLECIYEL